MYINHSVELRELNLKLWDMRFCIDALKNRLIYNII